MSYVRRSTFAVLDPAGSFRERSSATVSSSGSDSGVDEPKRDGCSVTRAGYSSFYCRISCAGRLGIVVVLLERGFRVEAPPDVISPLLCPRAQLRDFLSRLNSSHACRRSRDSSCDTDRIRDAARISMRSRGYPRFASARILVPMTSSSARTGPYGVSYGGRLKASLKISTSQFCSSTGSARPRPWRRSCPSTGSFRWQHRYLG